MTAQDLGSKIYRPLLNGRPDRALKSVWDLSGTGPAGRSAYLSHRPEDSVENILSVGKQLRAGHMVRLIDLPEAPRQGLWSNPGTVAEVDLPQLHSRTGRLRSRINGYRPAGLCFSCQIDCRAPTRTKAPVFRPLALNEEREYFLID